MSHGIIRRVISTVFSYALDLFAFKKVSSKVGKL
jgi:hypothetical protein